MEILSKVEKLKAELDSLRPINEEAERRIMQKFRLDWNYHSNSLEGNSLTYGETKALILFGITAQGKPLKDHFEITGHDEAIKWIEKVVKEETPLTETFIRQLHTLILKEPYEVDAVTPDGKPTKKKIEIGKYKTTPNHVRTQTGETFYFASPEETPAKMHDLIKWFREKKANPETNPVILAAEFHYKFILIHPFDDGNGRTARILMNFILMQNGYPPAIIKTGDKENYYRVLQQADAGILEPFIEYIAQNLARSLEIMIKGAKGESIEEPDDLDKELALLERELLALKAKIPITKNLAIVLELFDNSIVNLTEELLKMCKRFDKFYLEKSFHFMINGQSSHTSEEDALSKTRAHLSHYVDNLVNFRFQYIHNRLPYEGFDNVGWISGVNITFELAKFIIEDDYKENRFVKLYGEQLKKEEINKLVRDLAKLHKSFIEGKIMEVRKRAEEISTTITED